MFRRAEDRLEQHRHAITVVGESGKIEPGISQRAIVDACEAYDIGKEAIALLRRYHETLDTIHSFMHKGFDEKCFSCVLLQDGEKFLEDSDD